MEDRQGCSYGRLEPHERVRMCGAESRSADTSGALALLRRCWSAPTLCWLTVAWLHLSAYPLWRSLRASTGAGRGGREVWRQVCGRGGGAHQSITCCAAACMCSRSQTWVAAPGVVCHRSLVTIHGNFHLYTSSLAHAAHACTHTRAHKTHVTHPTHAYTYVYSILLVVLVGLIKHTSYSPDTRAHLCLQRTTSRARWPAQAVSAVSQ